MNVKLEVLTKEFEDALVRYKVACGKDWQFVLRQQTRIVAEKLMKFTPPKNLGTGKQHVAADIGKVFADLGNSKWEDKSLDKMWKAGNFEGVKAALSTHPNKDALPIFQYQRIFKQPIKNIHRAAIGRSGRVPKGFRTIYAVGEKGKLKKYITDVQKHVGIAKSGWLAALQKLNGKAPNFVSRHGTKFGELIDKNSGDDPHFDIINNVSTFPRGALPYRIMNRAINAQRVAMRKNVERISREKWR
jgi:hypothetical protein|nr:MAG TPA: hypothetical protein [Caudoviricetes sp.]